MKAYNLASDIPNLLVPAVRRRWWGAQPPVWKDPLLVPVSHVRFTHTATNTCTNENDCCAYLKYIQHFYVKEVGLADIPYNFIIGGDAIVYRGRGWYSEPARPENHKFLRSRCLDIAFIGNFTDSEPTHLAMKVAQDLLEYGVRTKKIKKGFKLIKLGEDPSPL